MNGYPIVNLFPILALCKDKRFAGYPVLMLGRLKNIRFGWIYGLAKYLARYATLLQNLNFFELQFY